MNREEIFNFSAGPSVLPEPVLRRAAEEMLNYRGSGMSVMEMSHRSPEFLEIFDGVKARLKAALSVPDSHEILFLQGGASMQFSMIPLNLTREGESADYAVTGHFAKAAAQEAERYCRVNVAASGEAENFTRIPGRRSCGWTPRRDIFTTVPTIPFSARPGLRAGYGGCSPVLRHVLGDPLPARWTWAATG